MTRLTEHFTLEEMTATNHRRFSNEPDAEAYANLITLAQTLESVRALLGGAPILITSGYRSPQINRAVGGSATSAHMRGLAADFTAPAFGPPAAVAREIAASGLQFDQLILEHGANSVWVHLAVNGQGRRQVLTMRRGRYTPGLE